MPNRIRFGEIPQDDPESLKDVPGETLRNTDILSIQPKVFKGQIQTDADACLYLAVAAQMYLAKEDRIPEHAQRNVISLSGIMNGARMLKEEYQEPWLSNHTARNILRERAGTARQIETLVPYIQENEHTGDGLVRLINSGMIASILLDTERHAVLAIGHSEDNTALVVWDPLYGKGDPKLRRIPTERTDIGFVAAVEVSPLWNPQDKKTSPKIKWG
ncbi:hypothetical protein JXA34_01330 [Patescibacteria group bacterium]|nr:hypothetical protein [Patescibacteria group bacterium]